MKYYKYYMFIFMGFLLAVLIWVGLVRFQTGAPTESTRWIHEVRKIKNTIAHSKHSPKIIVLSGSNSLFGIKSQMIEQELGISAVNMAIHAGLQLDYILKQAHSIAKKGDIILLPLEYELYNYTGAPDEILVDYVFARDPQYLRDLTIFEHTRFIFSIPPKRLITGVISKMHTPSPINRTYQSKTINANGDETNNRESDRTPTQEENIGRTPLKSITEGIPADTLAWEKLKVFNKWCNSQGITLLATFPCTVYYPEYDKLPKENAFKHITQFYHDINVPVLGSPQDFMYDRSSFYDTNYHLTDRAMVHRTGQIILLLRPYVER
ncbi:hypothetical protein Dtox_2848 [Desulfofarcimen acetoxidans DSM 771]|uniref:DUF1574 domain-containing protein n=1 Tax=Desulfofarcimen acetoxidans (strain ATCC 49208 / DSM 771 / KCTC 5769 / VKM B-1644 / 5575) TaxID=485916 RepID=C8W2C9_DESAS|nr:hypothetical protein [Desulfofarcimen acetoxidans]ACV63613.1 hypothetical protein Dtox_2848 [Desulfofarcimen acetoxidans DSM 771]